MRRYLLLLLLLLPLCGMAQTEKPSAARHTTLRNDPALPDETPATAEQPQTRPAIQPQQAQTQPDIQETAKPEEYTPQLSHRRHDEGIVVPEGTAIYFKLDHELSSRHNHQGDAFVGHVTRDVTVEGRTVIPAGASLQGSVTKTTDPRRIHGRPIIQIRAERIVLPDGTMLAVKGVMVDTAEPRRYHVGNEGQIRGPMVKNLEKVETLALAGSGAITGAIIAGPHGAIVGALVGLAIGTTHNLSRRHEMVLSPEVEIILELSGPAYSTNDARASLSPNN